MASNQDRTGRHASRLPDPVHKPYRGGSHREGKPGGKSVDEIQNQVENTQQPKPHPWFGGNQ